jgi:amino acid permease
MVVASFKSTNERKRANPELLGKGYVTNYDDLAEEALGRVGAVVMQIITVVETFGIATCFVVLHSVNWPTLLGLPPTVFGLRASWLSSIVMVSCAFPFTLIRVRYLALFSPIGLISTITLGVSSIAAPLWALHVHGGIDMQCEPLDGSVREATMSHAAFLPEGVGFAASLILFSFGGHAVFPDIYQQMPASERPHFDKAANIGFLTAGLFFTFIAAIGYGFYGSCVADTVTLNLMRSSPVFGSIATCCTLASTFFSFPVFCVPTVRILSSFASSVCRRGEPAWRVELRTRIEQVRSTTAKIEKRVEASAALMLLLAEKSGVKVPDQMASLLVGEGTPSVAKRGSAPDISVSPSADLVLSVGETPPKQSPYAEASTSVLQPMTATELASRVSVAASAVLLAISIPNFGFVVGLLGAFSSMLISFILPAAFYLHVHWSSLGAGSTMLCISIVIVGFVGMFVGLRNTLANGA